MTGKKKGNLCKKSRLAAEEIQLEGLKKSAGGERNRNWRRRRLGKDNDDGRRQPIGSHNLTVSDDCDCQCRRPPTLSVSSGIDKIRKKYNVGLPVKPLKNYSMKSTCDMFWRPLEKACVGNLILFRYCPKTCTYTGEVDFSRNADSYFTVLRKLLVLPKRSS